MENASPNQDPSPTPPPAIPPMAASPRYVAASDLADNGRSYSPFTPLLLLVLTAIAWPLYQCYQLFNEKNTLATIQQSQVKPFDDATKLRTALDSLARDTATLAANGNASAKLIVDELARRGVTIDASKAPMQPPKPAN